MEGVSAEEVSIICTIRTLPKSERDAVFKLSQDELIFILKNGVKYKKRKELEDRLRSPKHKRPKFQPTARHTHRQPTPGPSSQQPIAGPSGQQPSPSSTINSDASSDSDTSSESEGGSEFKL